MQEIIPIEILTYKYNKWKDDFQHEDRHSRIQSSLYFGVFVYCHLLTFHNHLDYVHNQGPTSKGFIIIKYFVPILIRE